MPIFYCPTPKLYGGMKQTKKLRIVSDQVSELIAFSKRYHGSLMLCPPDIKHAEREYLTASPDQRAVLREKIKRAAKLAVKLDVSLPDRGVEMHKSKVGIQILLPADQEEFLRKVGAIPIPQGYLPVLKMMMKSQYCRRSGVGLTPEAADYFESEIRGKTIDLCWSGDIIDHVTIPEIQNLHAQLENFDRGQWLGLKFSSTQSEELWEKRNRFAKGAETRNEANWKKHIAENIPELLTDSPTAPLPPKASIGLNEFLERELPKGIPD